jgi:Trm5-related predicted tRNA methylase
VELPTTIYYGQPLRSALAQVDQPRVSRYRCYRHLQKKLN